MTLREIIQIVLNSVHDKEMYLYIVLLVIMLFCSFQMPLWSFAKPLMKIDYRHRDKEDFQKRA